MQPIPIPPQTATAPRLMSERLDEYLPGLQSDDARRAFLTKLEAAIERAHGIFVDTGRITTHPSFAIRNEFDFRNTADEISRRLEALTERVAA